MNNELYIGRLVWNRLRYVKDPDTGKRISRLNPESKWIVQDVPELWINDQDLWDQARARGSALEIEPKTKPSGKPLVVNRRRPKYLFSGVIRCGCCGGGFSMISQGRLGCSTARDKNTCDNRLTIKSEAVERRVLTALGERLMEPALFAEFCQEFTKEMNRPNMKASASLAGKRAAAFTSSEHGGGLSPPDPRAARRTDCRQQPDRGSGDFAHPDRRHHADARGRRAIGVPEGQPRWHSDVGAE